MKLVLIIATLCSFKIYANEVKYNVTATTDYVWRGQTQTNNKSALQGGLDFYPTPNFQSGIWTSNVEGGSEIDLIARHTLVLADSLNVSFGGTYYYYTKNNAANTSEINLILNYLNSYFSVNHTPNYFGTDTISIYYELGSQIVFVEKEKLSLIPIIGFVTFDDNSKSVSTNHINYRIELVKITDEFVFKIFHSDTDRKVIQNDIKTDADDQGFGVSISKSF